MSLKQESDLLIVLKPGEPNSSEDIHFQNSDLHTFLMVFVSPPETTYLSRFNKILISP